MELLLSYTVGLSTVSIVKNPGGYYQYIVNDVAPEKYEDIARLVSKALESVDPQKRVGLYDITKAIAAQAKGYDLELITYVVSRELKYKKLQVLMDDPYVEDISIVGPGPVWVRHRYVLEVDPSADYIETNIVIGTYEEMMSYMELVAERSGKIINRRTPVMDFTLPEEDGGHRVHLVLPDVAYSTGEIVIRKKAYHYSTDMDSLVKAGMIPDAVAELIKLVIRRGGSIMILGPPGSGKTTLLKAILYSAIPRYWKIAIIEDTPEIDIPKGASWVRYTIPTDVWGSERGIDQLSLAKAALRASVSRFLVIGETRGAEAKVLVQAMNMGLGGLCLPGDQLLLARVDGRVDLYEIAEIVEGVLEGRYGVVEVVSVDRELRPKWSRVSRVVVKSGSSRFVRVEVEGGATHELHEDHPVLVASGDRGLTLKKASELRPGDMIPSLLDLPEFERVAGSHLGAVESLSTRGAFPVTSERPGSGTAVDHTGPRGVSPTGMPQNHAHGPSKEVWSVRPSRDLGYVLGALLASGSTVLEDSGTPVGVRLVVSVAKLPKLLRAMEGLGLSVGVDVTVESDGNSDAAGNAVRVLVSSPTAVRLLTGVLGGAKNEWGVPLELALGSGSEFRLGLVEGYWDIAGTVSPGDKVVVKAYAVSRKVAESMALLLRTLGILASVRAMPSKPGGGVAEGYYEVLSLIHI